RRVGTAAPRRGRRRPARRIDGHAPDRRSDGARDGPDRGDLRPARDLAACAAVSGWKIAGAGGRREGAAAARGAPRPRGAAGLSTPRAATVPAWLPVTQQLLKQTRDRHAIPHGG